MTDMITVSRKEIEALFAKYDMGRLSLSVIDDLRALLEKAEVVSGEPVAQVAQEGFGRGQVYWHKKCPPDGTDLYTTPQPSRIKEIAELQAREKVLVEALESIIESGLLNGSYKLHTKIDKIAREAIAKVEVK